jgi:hypothetical protein
VLRIRIGYPRYFGSGYAGLGYMEKIFGIINDADVNRRIPSPSGRRPGRGDVN